MCTTSGSTAGWIVFAAAQCSTLPQMLENVTSFRPTLVVMPGSVFVHIHRLDLALKDLCRRRAESGDRAQHYFARRNALAPAQAHLILEVEHYLDVRHTSSDERTRVGTTTFCDCHSATRTHSTKFQATSQQHSATVSTSPRETGPALLCANRRIAFVASTCL